VTAAEQLWLPSTLPIDPRSLLGAEPIERGRAYNAVDLDAWQRAAAEEALRMVNDGIYPEAGR
jgi:hypothetical protein